MGKVLDLIFMDFNEEHVSLLMICLFGILIFLIGGIVGEHIENSDSEIIAENLCEDNNGKLLDYEFNDDEHRFESIFCYKLNQQGIFNLLEKENDTARN